MMAVAPTPWMPPPYMNVAAGVLTLSATVTLVSWISPPEMKIPAPPLVAVLPVTEPPVILTIEVRSSPTA
jgi:hypothetical protein